MKYYLKSAIMPFIYLFFMMIIALGILAIKDLLWLKIILLVLNVGLYGLITSIFAFKTGQEGIKVRNYNDLERKQIIATGEPRKLKLHEEYKWYKGIIIGLIVCAPLVLCLIIHTIVHLCGGGNVFGTIGSIIYLMAHGFVSLFVNGDMVTWSTFYYSLIAIPIIVIPIAVSYYLGGRKIEIQQRKIRENQQKIYGDKL